VKPETVSYLEIANTLLAEADAIIGIHRHEAAGPYSLSRRVPRCTSLYL
jgi:hypothetical protein